MKESGSVVKFVSVKNLWTPRLQGDELAILTEVFIEGDNLRDAQSLHHYEANRITVAKIFVSVLFKDTSRSPLISLLDAVDIGAASVDGLKKLPGVVTSSANQDQSMGFRNDKVRREEGPALLPMSCIFPIQRRVESVGIDQHRFHRL
jgi:hypothetical protein